jgi:hypothetical protein
VEPRLPTDSAAQCEGGSYGGGPEALLASDSANLATHSLQMKIGVSLAKLLGSLTGYSAPKRVCTCRWDFLQNQHLSWAGSGGGWSAGRWCRAPRAAGARRCGGGGGCGQAGPTGRRRPRAGRSRRSAASGRAGVGSTPPAAGRRSFGSAQPRQRSDGAAGRRPRRTGPTRPRRGGCRGAGWRRRGRGFCRPPGAARVR